MMIINIKQLSDKIHSVLSFTLDFFSEVTIYCEYCIK